MGLLHAVPIGSGDHQFNLAEILSQNYSVEGECEEPSRCSDKPKEELEKDFISQTGFHHVGQARLQPLTTRDRPVSASRSAGMTAVSHHARFFWRFQGSAAT
ncbi:mesoderm induction early response protein 2-like isoform X4 [Saimiri boliviensis]|uniref:mesoderm induction early response protein 2-like isoform X4 n=1 Tax=Saimiri boliviensis TaxID=27679 RepID=UPI003D76D4C4